MIITKYLQPRIPSPAYKIREKFIKNSKDSPLPPLRTNQLLEMANQGKLALTLKQRSFIELVTQSQNSPLNLQISALRAQGSKDVDASIRRLEYLHFYEGTEKEEKEVDECLKRSQNLEKLSGDNCAIIYYSYNDHNGAFNWPRSTISKVNRLGLTTIFKRVIDTYDMLETTRTLAKTNQISALLIGAHGSASVPGGSVNVSGFELGCKEFPQTVTAESRKLQKTLSLLNPNALVLFQSCSAGKSKAFLSLPTCLARDVSQDYPAFTIAAPTENIENLQSIPEPSRQKDDALSLCKIQAKEPYALFQRGEILPPNTSVQLDLSRK